MSDQISLRVRESPIGGSRLAFSYLAVVLGLVVAGLVAAVWTPFADSVCGRGDDLSCGLGWIYAGVLLGVLAGTALTAFVFRLGWEWWLVLVALVLLLALASTAPTWLLAVFGILIPALAGAATWSGRDRPQWRPWAIAAAASVALAVLLVQVLA